MSILVSEMSVSSAWGQKQKRFSATIYICWPRHTHTGLEWTRMGEKQLPSWLSLLPFPLEPSPTFKRNTCHLIVQLSEPRW